MGDALTVLRELPSESVDCVATSPPFYALRDYGVEGQIGLETTPEEWAQKLVEVFRECRRVLADHGTLWVECGDSYAGSWGNQGRKSERGTQRPINAGMITPVHDGRYPDKGSNTGAIPPGTDLKPKDLLGQPWLLAFALRADGWYLRQAIIWHKPNAMPESVTDRCTTAHSYVFLLSKRPRYHFDAEAISEPAEWARWGDQTVPKYEGTDTASGWMQPKTRAELVTIGETPKGRLRAENGLKSAAPFGRGPGWRDDPRQLEYARSKNPRGVWSIPTRGYPGAHFATWPEALVERIIKAGCPERVCRTCGKASERLSEVSYIPLGNPEVQNAEMRAREAGKGTIYGGPQSMQYGRARKVTEFTGWSDCGHDDWRPGIVLDPFMGSGTTALVARKLGRHSVGIELNEDYCRLAAKRLQQLSLFAAVGEA